MTGNDNDLQFIEDLVLKYCGFFGADTYSTTTHFTVMSLKEIEKLGSFHFKIGRSICQVLI